MVILFSALGSQNADNQTHTLRGEILEDFFSGESDNSQDIARRGSPTDGPHRLPYSEPQGLKVLKTMCSDLPNSFLVPFS